MSPGTRSPAILTNIIQQCSRDANDFFLHNCPNDATLGRGDCNAVVKRIQQMCQELPAIHKRPWYDPSSCRKGIEEVIGTVEFCRRQRQPYRCLAKRRTAGEQCQVEARDFLYWRCFVTPKEPLKLAGCISFFLILVKECEGESSGLRGICIA